VTTLRDILNRARWASENLHDLELLVVHRGAPGDQRAIAGSRVVNVLAGGIEVAADEAEGESMFVPYHRFLAIRGAQGVTLWSKAEGVNPAAQSATATASAETQTPAAATPGLRVIETGVELLPTFSVLLHTARDREGLTIDGSAGEGGGQILRTSLSLSLLTGTPFTLERIRAGRKKPGLMRQHLTCVKAAAAISSAEVEGATLGSTRLVFRPRSVEGGEYELDIGSAGSAALVLQTLALPLGLAARPSRVCVRGGTHARWAPIYPFLEAAWLPLMQRAGAELALTLHKTGFYPAGGGEVVMTTSPSGALRPLTLEASRQPLDVKLEAVVAGIPEGIARRELSAAAELLQGTPLALHSASVRSPGPGNAMWLVAHAGEAQAATNVFSAIGEQGISAEQVAASVVNAFITWRDTNTSVEEHLADQVMLPIALAGEGSYTCSALSLHARTNIEVIHAFTGLRLAAWQLGDSRFRVELTRT
jgi:RNA 3'-terminal phosphate cyclase (ATP)